MHITPLPSTIPTETTSLPSVRHLESIPAICPYLQMCLDGVDLIPPEQRAIITAGSSSKKKKRAAPHADNVNTKRHCNECYLHFLGKTHPSLEGNYRYCPITYKSQAVWRETRLPTLQRRALAKKHPLLRCQKEECYRLFVDQCDKDLPKDRKKHRKVSPHANYWWCAYTDGLTSTFTEYCNNPNIQKLVQMWQGKNAQQSKNLC